jgi:nucleotide-binding universal stress UspA family protein
MFTPGQPFHEDMYEHILYPTDGSKGAAAAMENCRNIAETYGATVHVLHVIEHGKTRGFAGEIEVQATGGGDERESKEREFGEALVDEVTEQLGSVDTRTEVRRGTPHRVILDYVASNDIDLVVMGTHGRTGLDRYLLGSVAGRVVRMSDVPVLTVRG